MPTNQVRRRNCDGGISTMHENVTFSLLFRWVSLHDLRRNDRVLEIFPEFLLESILPSEITHPCPAIALFRRAHTPFSAHLSAASDACQWSRGRKGLCSIITDMNGHTVAIDWALSSRV